MLCSCCATRGSDTLSFTMPAKPKKTTSSTDTPSTSSSSRGAASKTKKAKRTKLAKAQAPHDVKVAVDAKLKGQWDKTLAAIEKAKGQGAEAFDELWEAVAAVVEHDPPLYVIGGYGSAAEFFEEVLKEKARTAYRFIRVAKYATPQEEERYGTTVLDAALAYVEATIGKPLSGPLPIAFDRLRIPVTRDGKSTRLSLAEATAEEIAKATRELTTKSGKSTAAPNPVEHALQGAMAGNSSLKTVRASVRGGVATFSKVPVASIPVFGKALAAVKVPVQAGATHDPKKSKTPAAKPTPRK